MIYKGLKMKKLRFTISLLFFFSSGYVINWMPGTLNSGDTYASENNLNIGGGLQINGEEYSGFPNSTASSPSVSIPLNIVPSGSTVTIPVHITGLATAGAISLRFNYNKDVLTYTGFANKPSAGNFSAGATNGVASFGWFNTTALGTDDGKFVDLIFTYNGGSTDLAFVTTQCEVTNTLGNPIPGISYVNGSISGTTVIKNPKVSLDDNVMPVGTTVTMPVNIEKLSEAGAISLKIQYDTDVLTFSGVANKPSVGNFSSGAAGGVVTVGWFNTSPLGVDSGKFVDIIFTYKQGRCDLTFLTTQCEITNRLGVAISPIEYVNGSVIGVISESDPVVNLLENISPNGSTVTVPVIIKNLSNAGALSLKVQYNSSVLTYTGYSNQPSTGNFSAGSNGGVVSFGWFNTSPIGIDSGRFVDLHFTYNSGTTALTFLTTQCEITNTLGDLITPIIYLDGSVVANIAPHFTVEMPDTAITQTQEYTFQYNAADPNPGTTLKYFLNKKPAGASIDSLTGLFRWTPNSTQLGDFEVSVIVTDGGLKDTSKVSIITVAALNQPPQFTSVLPDTTIHQMQTLTYQYKAESPNLIKAGLSKSTVLKFKKVNFPDGALIDSLTGIFTWKPTYKQLGNFKVVVSVSDGVLSSKDSSVVSVLKTNVAPQFSEMEIQDTLHANRTYTFQLKAEDPNGDPVTFSLGSNPPSGVSITGDQLKWIVGLNHSGSYNVVVIASDESLSKDTTITFLVTSAVGVEKGDRDLPTTFGLKQNFPNPFNPTTFITYQIPTSEFVTLTIYNVLGKEVSRLVSEQKSAGEYQVQFNSENLQSGIYLYQLKAGSYSEVRKMLLLK
jgi:hypothetical protein